MLFWSKTLRIILLNENWKCFGVDAAMRDGSNFTWDDIFGLKRSNMVVL